MIACAGLSIGSLFSGIGGIEMGLESAIPGSRVAWQAECDPDCLRALEHHWPGVKRYDDVRDIDENTECVDIICGGFPCQGVSNAGKRAGLSDKRSGLWSEYARIVRLLRPRFVFVENVSALLHRGFDTVLGDLAALGYDAECDVFSSLEVDGGHERERLFILAHVDGGHGATRVGRREGGQEPVSSGATAQVHALRVAPRCPVPTLVDGLPRRLARLPGNAVDPRVAALAWKTLSKRIGVGQ